MNVVHKVDIPDSYRSYKEFDESIDLLYSEQRFAQAATKLREHIGDHPDFAFELSAYLLYCLEAQRDDEAVVALLREGHSGGWAFPLGWERWDRFRNRPDWESILQTNRSNLEAIERASEPEVRLYAPESRIGPMPLFIVLHGDGVGCNIDLFEKEWRPDVFINRGYAVAYFQSSRPQCTGGFGWTTDYEQTRTDVRMLYDEVVRHHEIDTTRVCIGGFSGGSMASLNVMAKATVPVRGVVALCPNPTEDVTREAVANAASAGVRLCLLEGEHSGDVPWHRELIAWANAAGMPSRYRINPGVGHAVPAKWSPILEEVLDFIEG